MPRWLCSHPAVAPFILPHVLHVSSDITVIFNILCKYYYLYNAFLLSFLPSAPISLFNFLYFFFLLFLFSFSFTIWLFTCNTLCLELYFCSHLVTPGSVFRTEVGVGFSEEPPLSPMGHVCMTLTCLPAALLLHSCLLRLSPLCKNSGSSGRNFCLLHDTARTYYTTGTERCRKYLFRMKCDV